MELHLNLVSEKVLSAVHQWPNQLLSTAVASNPVEWHSGKPRRTTASVSTTQVRNNGPRPIVPKLHLGNLQELLLHPLRSLVRGGQGDDTVLYDHFDMRTSTAVTRVREHQRLLMLHFELPPKRRILHLL